MFYRWEGWGSRGLRELPLSLRRWGLRSWRGSRMPLEDLMQLLREVDEDDSWAGRCPPRTPLLAVTGEAGSTQHGSSRLTRPPAQAQRPPFSWAMPGSPTPEG